MKKVALERVQADLGSYVKNSINQPIVILQNGAPVAMIVGLRRTTKRRPAKLRHILKRAWKDYQQHGGISHERFWEDLAAKTEEMRA